MSDEDLINLWNKGLTKVAVAKRYMQDFNEKAKNRTDIKKINKEQALAYIEPILFKYRMEQLKS
jgi:hypothetical protein